MIDLPRLWGGEVVAVFDWPPVVEIIASHYPGSKLVRRLPEYGTSSGLVRVVKHLDPNPLRLCGRNGLTPLGEVTHEYGIWIQGVLTDERRVLFTKGEACYQELRRLDLSAEDVPLINSKDYWSLRLE